MMLRLEMYVIIIITMMTLAQGLQQNCFYYCKHLPNQPKSLVRPECNCTAINQDNLLHSTIILESKDSEIDYEPLNLNTTEIPRHEEKSIHKVNTTTEVSEHDGIHFTRTISVEDENNLYNSSFPKYKRNGENGTENIIEFPLYLDIDLHTQVNDGTLNLKEDLKHIFEKVRASEKDLSECINLHIYIFSKNIDNINKTQTNWGHHVKYDNLSNSEVLTEIQNKCDYPTTIIHESIYEIRQREHEFHLPQNNTTSTENNTVYEDEVSSTNPDVLSKPLTYRDLYQITSDIESNSLQQASTTSMDVVEKAKFQRNDIDRHTLFASTQHPVQNSEEYINVTGNKTTLMSHIDSTKPTSHKGLRRHGYEEKDILIPKIITKELANNTVTSVLDGYETMPNLDFVSYNDIKGDASSSQEDNVIEPTQSSLSIHDIGNHNQSDLIQDIKGNLYFSFGNDQIPARFIQNSEGEMHLAVDGFSLCDQVVQRQENKLPFMNVLCDCIKFHNCSPVSKSTLNL